MRFQDRGVFVTGAGSGIGRASALLVAGEGAAVACADIDERAAKETVALVEQAQGSRAEDQRLADRVSAVFVPVALGVAVLSLIGWLVTGRDVDAAFTAAVVVLIIACPCALGLATPLGIMVGTGRGAQLGVIIKGGEILEDTRAIDTIVLDMDCEG